ncbi:MAG TPA: polysaccharide deacetylase family protein [Nitrososphaeraceae archaeon]
MLKMVFLGLLLFGLIFNLVTIELSLSISAYGQIPYIPSTSPSLSNQEQQSSSSSASSASSASAAALTSVGGKNNQVSVLNGLNNNNTGKVVILTFGDGLQSQYTYAKPILDKYGFKANFFVTCNKVGLRDKITWQELVQLYKEGHVIGSKTVDYGTKAKGDIDLNHLSANKLEYEVGQSKQCLLDHGINTTVFAVPKNVASDNQTVVNTISKYYDYAINGHSHLMYLYANRYSIGEWSMQHVRDNGTSYNNSQMFSQFVAALDSQNKFNEGGMINAIPVIGYHEIIPAYTDVSYTNKSSDTTLNLFEAEMKYLHDNGFRVITFYDIGYDQSSNSLFIKTM